MAISVVSSVKPTVKTSIRYMIRNRPPPSFAARYGNLHKFPTPTALPAAGKNIDDIGAYFSVSDVRNDVTGNWRISTIAENIDIQEYALSYYKEYFKDDKEIHAIVNFNYKTTTKISVIGNTLDVSIYDYVDGEEHDAKLLFSGTLLKEYSVNMDNGSIEEIQ